MKKTVITALALIFSLITIQHISPVFAQNNTNNSESAKPTHNEAEQVLVQPSKEIKFQARVTNIISEEIKIAFGTEQLIQDLELEILSQNSPAGDFGEKLVIESGGVNVASTPKYKIGDKVLVSAIDLPDGTLQYFVLDYVRTDALLYLFILFVVVTITVARWKGLASLLGMAYSFIIIFKFVLPQIFAGQNPIIVALIGGLAIVPITFYISHGFNKKTHTAIISTLITLTITGVLAYIAIQGSKLTGFATEDAAFLELASGGSINIRGLILAGIIVGLFGILDDITISQAAIVYKLKKTSPNLSYLQLYNEAMDIGKDHIGSLINTLILVYTGAALPFLLLFTNTDQSLTISLSYEIIAEEIVRTLVGSIGLVLAVPITTFIAART